MKPGAPQRARSAAPPAPPTASQATVPAGPAAAQGALDLLLELVARFGMVSIDARDLPVCVWVQTDAGPRHWYGGSTSQALAIALSATAPRQTSGPEHVSAPIARVLSKLKPEGDLP